MHSHHTHASRHKGRLQAVLALTVSFLGVELAFALWTGSLSLLADAVHLLADVGGVLLSLVAIWFAERPATATKKEIQQNLILFDFGREIQTQFHMQNVPDTLDIAFAKADGRIFAILRMEPSPTALYGPMGDFRYALEARKGFYEQQGIKQGEARLVVPPG